MAGTELTEIGPDEWEQFRDVRLRSLADAPTTFGSRYDDWVHAPAEAWRSRLRSVPLTVLARQRGRIVGVVSGTFEGNHDVELISMWVAPEARGTGVAAALAAAVVAWAADRERGTLLMVRSDNARAIAAYERAGFVDEGVPADHPADQPPENRMEYRTGDGPS